MRTKEERFQTAFSEAGSIMPRITAFAVSHASIDSMRITLLLGSWTDCPCLPLDSIICYFDVDEAISSTIPSMTKKAKYFLLHLEGWGDPSHQRCPASGETRHFWGKTPGTSKIRHIGASCLSCCPGVPRGAGRHVEHRRHPVRPCDRAQAPGASQ